MWVDGSNIVLVKATDAEKSLDAGLCPNEIIKNVGKIWIVEEDHEPGS